MAVLVPAGPGAALPAGTPTPTPRRPTSISLLGRPTVETINAAIDILINNPPPPGGQPSKSICTIQRHQP